MTTTKPAAPRRMRSAERAADLRRVAEATFLDVGFHGASMNDIAARAGVTRAILYRHYPSKDALAAACLAASRHRLREMARDDGDAAEPLEAMRSAARRIVAFIGTHSRLFLIFLADDTFNGSQARAEAEAIRDDLERAAARALTQAAPDTEPAVTQLIARGLVGAGSRIAEGLDWSSTTPDDLDQLVDLSIGLLRNGLPGLTAR